MRPIRLAALFCLFVLTVVPGCKREEKAPAAPTAPAVAPTAPPAQPPTQPPTVPPTPVPTPVLNVSAIDLGRQIGPDKRVTEATTVFAPTDTIYVSVIGTADVERLALRARWIFEDGQVVNETEQTIAPSGETVTEFHIARPSGWPTGKYKVEIAAGGAPLGSKEFEVR